MNSSQGATFNTVRTFARLVGAMKKRRGGKRKEKESIGALMAKARWSKTTAAQRHQVGLQLVEARRKKRLEREKKRLTQ